MEFEIRHILSKPPEVAFSILTSPAFLAEVDARVTMDKTLLESREDDHGWVRVWRIIERGDKPAFISKIVGPAFEYTLEQRTERAHLRTSWRVTPSVGADRVRAEGFEAIEAAETPAQSVRIVRGIVEVDAPFFGKRLADFIGAEVRRGYERSLTFVERFIQEHP